MKANYKSVPTTLIGMQKRSGKCDGLVPNKGDGRRERLFGDTPKPKKFGRNEKVHYNSKKDSYDSQK